MRKLIFPIVVALLSVAVIWSSSISAQGGQNGKGSNMPVFADCDLNGDGTITEEEFTEARAARIVKRTQEGRQMKNLANAPPFDDIDTDDDGGISPDEFAAHQAEHKAKKQASRSS